MYLLEADLAVLKYKSLPKGLINAALRLGNNLTNGSTQILQKTQQKDLAIKLQLKLQNLTEAHRCTVTLSFQDGRILGVAVITLPKIAVEINTFSKLIQCQDKKAELFLTLKISKVDKDFEENQNRLKQLQKVIQNGNISPIKRKQSVKHAKTNFKSQPSFENFDRLESANIMQSCKTALKNKDDDSEGQVNRLKQQKQVYFQLYKIQKSKSEVAAKFISSLIYKLTNNYPELLNCFIDQPLAPVFERRNSPKKNENAGLIAQLQQANSSLHRQIQQYKKILEQLKGQLFKNDSLQKSKKEAYNDSWLPFRSSIQKNQKVLAPLKQQKASTPFQGIDLKQLLQVSILQRTQLQQCLKQIPKHAWDQRTSFDKTKLKSKIDKSIQSLLQKQSLSRTSIIIHKRQITKIIDQCCS